VEETLDLVIDALKQNPNDVTMATIYSYVASESEDASDLQLRGSIGVPDGHACAPKTARLEKDQHGLLPFFRQARETGTTVVLSETDGTLQQLGGLLDGISWCGFGEPSRDVVVQPLMSSGTLLGFYVQGTNPRRVYDELAQMSINDVARQIEAKWRASLTNQQAKRREEALERRATESENRLRHMAVAAPIGMLQLDREGRIQWANDQFYQMTGHDRTKPSLDDFWECMHPDDVQTAQQLLVGLLANADREVREFRLRRTWTPPMEGADDEPIWVLSVNFPLLENGAVKLVMCYLLDISQQKWAESVQSRNATAAFQAKAQQEASSSASTRVNNTI
jgi:PAS domain S-box-containing protein